MLNSSPNPLQYLISLFTRTMLSIQTNQASGLLETLSPTCKVYITGFTQRLLTGQLNQEDKSTIQLSGNFIQELGSFENCQQSSGMAYYLVQMGVDIVRVNFGFCFTRKCSDDDWATIRNYFYSKLSEKLSSPNSKLKTVSDFLVINVDRVRQIKGFFSNFTQESLVTLFFIVVLVWIALVCWASFSKMAENRHKKTQRRRKLSKDVQKSRITRSMILREEVDSVADLIHIPKDSKKLEGDLESENSFNDSLVKPSPEQKNSVVSVVEISCCSKFFNRLRSSFVECFSLQRTTSKIVNYKIDSPERLSADFLHIFNFMSVMLVNFAFGEATLSKLITNYFDADGYFHSFKHTIEQGSFFVPDTMLFVSGFLGTSAVIRRLKNQKSTESGLKPGLFICTALKIYFKKYFRYVFGLFLPMLYIWKVLSYTSSGPLKVTDFGCFPKNVVESVFLLNSNFGGNNRRMCGIWYWYPAAEFQLFLTVPFICLLFLYKPRFATTLSLFLSMGGVTVTAWYNQYHQIKATNDHDMSWATSCMTYSYTRSAGFFLGCFCCLMGHTYKDALNQDSDSNQISIFVSTAKKLGRETLGIIAFLIGLFIFLVDFLIFYYFFQASVHNLGFPQWTHTLFNTFGPLCFGLSFVLIFSGLAFRFFDAIVAFLTPPKPITSFARYLSLPTTAKVFFLLRSIYWEVFLWSIPVFLTFKFNDLKLKEWWETLAYSFIIIDALLALAVASLAHLFIYRPFGEMLERLVWAGRSKKPSPGLSLPRTLPGGLPCPESPCRSRSTTKTLAVVTTNQSL